MNEINPDDAFLLALLMDANQSANGWQEFLETFRQHFNLHSCHLYIENRKARSPYFHYWAGIEDSEISRQENIEKNFIADVVMKYFAPAKMHMGLHWAPFDDTILPPIIDVNLVSKAEENKILVYLPFENQRKVTVLLKQFTDKHFIQYSPDVINFEDENVSLRTTCYAGFKKDLCSASGVISNSGFELISECLHLGLPVLVKPLQGQMEQEANALALEQLQYSTVMRTLDYDIINEWINALSKEQKTVKQKTPDVAQEIVTWLLSSQESSTQALAATLWQKYQS